MTEDAKFIGMNFWILRCQMGDQRAFNHLVEVYQGPLICFVHSLLGRSEGAEDIVQGVWLTVVKKIYTLRDPLLFSVWLYQIARRKVYVELRRARTNFVLGEVEEPLIHPPDVPIQLEVEEEVEKLYLCLQKIKTEHREVLMLQFLEQMSMDQIAFVTQSKVGTVKSRIYYAKLSLRKEMERLS